MLDLFRISFAIWLKKLKEKKEKKREYTQAYVYNLFLSTNDVFEHLMIHRW